VDLEGEKARSVNAGKEGGLAGSLCTMGTVAVTIATAAGDLAVELDPAGASNFRLFGQDTQIFRVLRVIRVLVL
jgi:hypothetical protein